MFKLGLCVSIYTQKSSFLILSYQLYIIHLVDCEIGNAFQLQCSFFYIILSPFSRVRILWCYWVIFCLFLAANILIDNVPALYIPSLRQWLACNRCLNACLFKKYLSTYYELGIFLGICGCKTTSHWKLNRL